MAGYRPSLKPEFAKGGVGCATCGTETTKRKPEKVISAPTPINRAATIFVTPPPLEGEFLFIDGENDIHTVDDILRINRNIPAEARNWCTTYFGTWLDAGEDIEVFKNTLKRILDRREYAAAAKKANEPVIIEPARKKPGRKAKA